MKGDEVLTNLEVSNEKSLNALKAGIEKLKLDIEIKTKEMEIKNEYIQVHMGR